MTLPTVNISAVLLATVLSMGLGFLWFSPLLFGKKWMKLMKLSEKDSSNVGQSMVYELINTFVFVYVLAVLLEIVKPTTLQDALQFGFLLWLGLVVTMEMSAVIWAKKNTQLVGIGIGGSLVSIFLAIAVLMNMQ
jgi:hypothetical protein